MSSILIYFQSRIQSEASDSQLVTIIIILLLFKDI
jgi:hypothetical protein